MLPAFLAPFLASAAAPAAAAKLAPGMFSGALTGALPAAASGLSMPTGAFMGGALPTTGFKLDSIQGLEKSAPSPVNLGAMLKGNSQDANAAMQSAQRESQGALPSVDLSRPSGGYQAPQRQTPGFQMQSPLLGRRSQF